MAQMRGFVNTGIWDVVKDVAVTVMDGNCHTEQYHAQYSRPT